MTDLSLTVNGEELRLSGVDPSSTLLQVLRDRGLTGAKEGCAEGECGACAVVVVRPDGNGGSRFEPVNSCLVLAGAMAGQEVWTVEGMRAGAGLHPVQHALVEHGASQCGYCTPGFVASMFGEYYRRNRDGFELDAIAGNLCRCTGYRPIRDAVRTLGAPEPGDPHAERLGRPAPAMHSVRLEQRGRRFFRPSGLGELFQILEEHPHARLIAGGTDVVVEMNQRHVRFDVLVSLEAIDDLRGIDWTDDCLDIGAGEPLSSIEDQLQGRLPILAELLPLFSSRLIRNRATLGGNVANASPIGDGPPVLLALDADLSLASARGPRTVPLDGFFTGYRRTLLEPGEVITRIRIPRPFPAIGRFYKVSKRELDDISTVAAAFTLRLDTSAQVTSARLAYGGVAPTPVRAAEAERALVGRRFDEDAVAAARSVLADAFSPIDDHRGSAAYRRAMVVRLFEKLHADVTAGAQT